MTVAPLITEGIGPGSPGLLWLLTGGLYVGEPLGPAVQITDGWWAYTNTDLIQWFAYDPTTEIMLVHLADGTERSFSGVPFQIANRLYNAKDSDLYYETTIQNSYPRVFG